MPSVGVWGETHAHRNKCSDWASSKKSLMQILNSATGGDSTANRHFACWPQDLSFKIGSSYLATCNCCGVHIASHCRRCFVISAKRELRTTCRLWAVTGIHPCQTNQNSTTWMLSYKKASEQRVLWGLEFHTTRLRTSPLEGTIYPRGPSSMATSTMSWMMRNILRSPTCSGRRDSSMKMATLFPATGWFLSELESESA